MAYTEEFIKEIDKNIKDEEEAVLGYDKTLKLTKDEHIKTQIEKIKLEEVAHKKFLEELKENPKAIYHDPSDNEEKSAFEEINKKRMGR